MPTALARVSPFQKACLAAFLCAVISGPLAAERKQPKNDLAAEMPADAHHLRIGDAAPDFSLPGIDGKTYRLADFKDAPVLMVVFSRTTAPIPTPPRPGCCRWRRR